MGWRRRLELAAVVVFVLAYAGLSHYGNSAAKTHDLGVGLALGPVLSVALVLLWRSTHFVVALFGCRRCHSVVAPLLAGVGKEFLGGFLLQEGGFYSIMAASFRRCRCSATGCRCARNWPTSYTVL